MSLFKKFLLLSSFAVTVIDCFALEENKIIQADLDNNGKDSISVLLTTFNAGAASPPEECQSRFRAAAANSLCQWIAQNGTQPDLVVIGLQEMTELTLGNYVSIAMTANVKRKMEWLEALDETVKALGNYERLEKIRLFGVFLVVYKKEGINVTEVQTKSIGTGLLGDLVGNKGAVGISLVVNRNLSICFINNHLPAGDSYKALLQRHASLKRIKKKMVFDDGTAVMDHSVVFWMGDFNYRLSGLWDTIEQVMEKCSKSHCKELLQYDELSQYLKSRNNGLNGFQEPLITFRPTYKFQKGTTQWDNDFEDRRMPSWCDRILYRSNLDWNVEPRAYRSIEGIDTSDHKPVVGLFSIKRNQRKARFSGDNPFAGNLVKLDE